MKMRMKIEKIEEEIQNKVGYYRRIRDSLKKSKNKEKELQKEEILLQKVIEIFDKVSKDRADEVVKQIKSILDAGFSEVFYDRNYSTEVVFDERRGKFYADILLRDEDKNIQGEAKKMAGGGVFQVQQFLLFIILKVLLKEGDILVLDETFSMVSVSYRENLAKLVQEIAQKFGITILLVTHSEEILAYADKIYRMELFGNGIKVTEER